MFVIILFALAATATTAVDVIPLVDEQQSDVPNSQFTMGTLSTLIKDGDNTIVVDAPPNQSAAEQKMLDALQDQGLTADNIKTLVLTRSSFKNFDRNSIFPNCRQLFSIYELGNGLRVLRSDLSKKSKMQLTPNVQLWHTSGYKQDDISVVVSNVANKGIVAIVGNLIFSSNDLLEPTAWEGSAKNLQVGRTWRRRVVCHADYIIPGQGTIFQVTAEHKRKFMCHVNDQALDNGIRIAVSEGNRKRRETVRNQRTGYRSSSNADCCQQQPCHNNQLLCTSKQSEYFNDERQINDNNYNLASTSCCSQGACNSWQLCEGCAIFNDGHGGIYTDCHWLSSRGSSRTSSGSSGSSTIVGRRMHRHKTGAKQKKRKMETNHLAEKTRVAGNED